MHMMASPPERESFAVMTLHLILLRICTGVYLDPRKGPEQLHHVTLNELEWAKREVAHSCLRQNVQIGGPFRPHIADRFGMAVKRTLPHQGTLSGLVITGRPKCSACITFDLL
jgi:hypothetical protein